MHSLRLCAKTVVLWVGIAGILSAAVRADIIYVDSAAIGSNNGTTWADAYIHLQDALASADTGDDIYIAAGKYRPDQGTSITLLDRTASFHLKSGVAIYGGFPPAGGIWEERNMTANITILSGDLAENDGQNFLNNTENSYHVLTGSSVDATAVLDGCTVTAGNANGDDPQDRGAALYSISGNATIRDCIFTQNKTGLGGALNAEASSNLTLTRVTFSGNQTGIYGTGGALRIWDSSPILTDCIFTQNRAYYGAAVEAIRCSSRFTRCQFLENITENEGSGGGLYLIGSQSKNSRPILTDCLFRGNHALYLGGGIYSAIYTYPYLVNCLFLNNIGEYAGGGIWSSQGAPKLTNCIFSGNRTGAVNPDASGGGMYNGFNSAAEIRNCTFSQNSANRGGALFVYYSTAVIANNIVWGNSAPIGSQLAVSYSGTLTASYCDIQGGQTPVYVDDAILNWLPGNITANPLFLDADGEDNILGTEDDNLRLDFGSPAVDAGNNSMMMADTADLDEDSDTAEPIPLDYDRQNRFVDDPDVPDTGSGTPAIPSIVDMGAFERPFPVCGDQNHPYPMGDLNLDCRVNSEDVALLVSHWLENNCSDPQWCQGADLNLSGDVNLFDFGKLASAWLACTAPLCE